MQTASVPFVRQEGLGANDGLSVGVASTDATGMRRSAVCSRNTRSVHRLLQAPSPMSTSWSRPHPHPIAHRQSESAAAAVREGSSSVGMRFDFECSSVVSLLRYRVTPISGKSDADFISGYARARSSLPTSRAVIAAVRPAAASRSCRSTSAWEGDAQLACVSSGSMNQLGRMPLRVFSIDKYAFQKALVRAR